MKKLLLAILGCVALAGQAHASITPEELNNVPITSYTEANTPSFVLFTSATIQWVGITISSPALGSYLVIDRSTSPTFTQDASTSVLIVTDFINLNGGPVFVDLYGMYNSSYTYINKVGNAKLIYWYRCPKRRDLEPGLCPGVGRNGFGVFGH